MKVPRQSESDKVVIIGCGVTVHEGLKAADILREKGVNARVLDLFSIKPIDAANLNKNISECSGQAIIVEDHYPEGGIYEAVLGVAHESIKRVKHLAVRSIPGSAKPDEQMNIHGINSAAIVREAEDLLK